GDAANDLFGVTLDPNVRIQESKVASCDIQPGRRPRGSALLEYVQRYRERAGITIFTGNELRTGDPGSGGAAALRPDESSAADSRTPRSAVTGHDSGRDDSGGHDSGNHLSGNHVSDGHVSDGHGPHNGSAEPGNG